MKKSEEEKKKHCAPCTWVLHFLTAHVHLEHFFCFLAQRDERTKFKVGSRWSIFNSFSKHPHNQFNFNFWTVGWPKNFAIHIIRYCISFPKMSASFYRYCIILYLWRKHINLSLAMTVKLALTPNCLKWNLNMSSYNVMANRGKFFLRDRVSENDSQFNSSGY